jgi:hypothetical protein
VAGVDCVDPMRLLQVAQICQRKLRFADVKLFSSELPMDGFPGQHDEFVLNLEVWETISCGTTTSVHSGGTRIARMSETVVPVCAANGSSTRCPRKVLRTSIPKTTRSAGPIALSSNTETILLSRRSPSIAESAWKEPGSTGATGSDSSDSIPTSPPTIRAGMCFGVHCWLQTTVSSAAHKAAPAERRYQRFDRETICQTLSDRLQVLFSGSFRVPVGSTQKVGIS